MNSAKVIEEVFTEDQRVLIADQFDRIKDTCYLDHTGSALYCSSMIENCLNDLQKNIYSNPHSRSTTSKHCTDSIDQVRYRILEHFNTDTSEYSVVFTSGATAALKLVAESFCWHEPIENCEWYPQDLPNDKNALGHFVYLEDNHTSVLGMRDVARDRGAEIYCLEHNEGIEVFASGNCDTLDKAKHISNSLFVYPAQCNFSGVKYPLAWVNQVQGGTLDKLTGQKSNWFCLLDAATFVSTNSLDLSEVQPDFVCISFYKMFGYPTGIGALLVKNSSQKVLQKRYYGGGTVLIALSSENSYVPRDNFCDRFEDGTLNFLSIISLSHGFTSLLNHVQSMENVSRHCFYLAKYTFYSLLELHHGNGSPAVHLYTDTAYEDITTQGNIVNFNMMDKNGDYIGYAEVLNMANLHNIQIRTGCFCNPGACRRHLGLSSLDVKKHYKSGHVCGDDNDLVNGQPTGSVRVSFGYYSTKEDVDKFLRMLEKCFVSKPIRKIPTKWNCTAKKLSEKFKSSFTMIKSAEKIKIINGNNSEVNYTEIPKHSEQNKESNIFKHSDIIQKEPHISHIFLYPVKSCGRFEVNHWELDSKGLKYDRLWMVTNSRGVALTQKREPRMCLIRPVVDVESGKLRLNFTGHKSISVHLDPNSSDYDEVSLCRSKVCGDSVKATDCGDEVAEWLSSVLEREGLRLIRQFPDDTRSIKKSTGTSGLSLANQGQYLMINMSSVKTLSQPTLNGIVHRFRSNFVVEGEEPYAECDWSSVQIGNIKFNVDGPCSRCEMIYIDQDSGEINKETVNMLSNGRGRLKFGVYLSKISNGQSFLDVGDRIIAQ